MKVPNKCKYCNKELFKSGYPNTTSTSCRDCYNKNRKTIRGGNYCGVCSKPLYRSSRTRRKNYKYDVKFCKKHWVKERFKRVPNKSWDQAPRWVNGHKVYRKYFLGDKCEVCGITESELALEHKVLYVHHVDEDRTNNDRYNLLTCCPKCHRGVLHKKHKKGEVYV